MSAKEPGRPQFNQMLEEIEQGRADGIVCWALNRLFRNPVDEGRVRWLLQRGVIKFIRTANREYLPSDAGLLMAIEGGQASDELSRLRQNVSRGIRQKLLDGAWPGCRPPGYIYDYDKRNIAPHPKFGRVVTIVFSEYATGALSLRSTATRLAELGLKTKSGRLWPNSKVHLFLTNKLYIGVMIWKLEAFEGKYQPLVSPDVFEKVAVALKVRSKPRKTRHIQTFPLRGLFHCSCGAMLTAQNARGNGGLYRYYRCGRTMGTCNEKYLGEATMLSQIHSLVAPIGLPLHYANELEAIVRTIRSNEDGAVDTHLAQVDRDLSEVQLQLDNLTRACARLTVDDESYATAATELLTRKASLKAKKKSIHLTNGSDWFEPVMETISGLALAAKPTSKTTVHEIASFLRTAATNHQFSGRKVSFEWAEPYAYTAQLVAGLASDMSANRSESNNGLDSRPILLRIATYLRTHFSKADAREEVCGYTTPLEPISRDITPRDRARSRI